MLQKLLLLICVVQFATGEQKNIELSITFNKTNGDLECGGKSTFTYNEGYNISMILNNVMDVCSASCHVGDNTQQNILLTNFTQEPSFKLRSEILQISYGRIICDFRIDFDHVTWNKHVTCTFEIKVRYLKSLKAYANGKLLENNSENKDWDVDAQAIYYFRPNELVNIKCAKPTDVRGTLQFIDEEKDNFSKPESIDVIEYQMILTDRSYIDCIFDSESSGTTKLRIHMIPEDGDGKDMIVINDLNVRPNDNTALVFMYSGFLPTVKCDGNSTLVETRGSPSTSVICPIKGKKWTLRFYKDMTCADVNGFYEKIKPELMSSSHVQKLNTFTTRFKCVRDRPAILQYIIIQGNSSDIQNYKSDTASSFFKNHYMEFSGGALLLLLLLIIYAILVFSKKRKRSPQCDQCGIQYSNLPCGLISQLDRRLSESHTESTRLIDQYMSPADVYDEINPYSVPYNPENYSKNKEDGGHYAELDLDDPKGDLGSNGNSVSPYAVVQTETKDLYAKVKPKCDRN